MLINNRGIRGANAGSAMIETAILMPIYMILVYGLIFFGHSTLARQRSQVAAHFTAMHSDIEGLDPSMMVNFGWAPVSASGYQSGPGGSQFDAGDATIRIANNRNEADFYSPGFSGAPPSPPGTGTTFEAARLADYLWIAAVGQIIERFEWRDGEIVRIEDQNHTYSSRYLQDNSIVNPPPPASPGYTSYILGAASTINNAHAAPWLERRSSSVEYEYGPRILRYAIGERPMTSDEYLGLDFPEPDFVPLYTLESSVMTRGIGGRPGTLQQGSSQVTGRMSSFVGDGRSLPTSISIYDYNDLRDNLWPGDSDSIWVAK